MKKRWKVYIGILLVVIVINLLSWFWDGFTDWYIKYVMPVWVNTYGRFMGLFPFSVGEIFIVLGVFVLGFTFFLSLYLMIRSIVLRLKKKYHSIQWTKVYYTGFAWTLLVIVTLMSLNYSVLYHGTGFNQKYLGREERQYSLEELLAVRNYVVLQCNELSQNMKRDENGYLVYEKDIADIAIVCMQDLGNTYKELKGFYPRPKPLLMSDLMCQQYMQGYFFPFSMEANYNDVMYISNKPAAICHELAHFKGIINEDEANFTAYLACIEASDPFVRYSGYMSVLYYLDNDFYDAIGRNRKLYEQQENILEQVHKDNIFVTEENWDRINKKALVDTEVVSAVSDQFTETYLKLNGVADGMISYNRVVKLLLQYYEGRLF